MGSLQSLNTPKAVRPAIQTAGGRKTEPEREGKRDRREKKKGKDGGLG